MNNFIRLCEIQLRNCFFFTDLIEEISTTFILALDFVFVVWCVHSVPCVNVNVSESVVHVCV